MIQKIAILCVISLFLVACSAQEAPVAQDLPVAQDMVVEEIEEDLFFEDEPETSAEQVAQDLPTLKEFSLIAQKFEFVPDTITVSRGDTVRMSIESVDVDHGITISAFGVNEYLESGETTIVEFVANKRGEFPFICSVFCGSGHGQMRGMLVVE